MGERHWGIEALERLSEEYADCQRCPALCKTRSTVVFGSGNARADLMVIGELPGEEEDADGSPFVGRSGRLLMDMIRLKWPDPDAFADLGNDDDDDEYFAKLRNILDDFIFWTNAGLCWPGEGNRAPSTQELKECRARLHETIYAVDPMLILMVGKVAATALVGKTVGILERRGNIFDIHITSPATGKQLRYPAMAILHPSFLLRKGDQPLIGKKSGHTYDTLEDLGFAFHLLDQQYQSLFGTSFPDRPMEYKSEQ